MQGTAHDFRLAFPESFPTIEADEARLRRVMDNLLGNAVKYAPAGGLIEVGGQANAAAVTVFVRDEGVGISADEQEQIFERFYRVNNTLGQGTQGTGLGLYLSRSIVEAHGGTIGVESRPGRGATFHFTLPRTTSGLRSQQPAIRINTGVEMPRNMTVACPACQDARRRSAWNASST